MERTVERKFWDCDTCEDTIAKPIGHLPEGWGQVRIGRRSLHICPECLPTAIRQLNDQAADTLDCRC